MSKISFLLLLLLHRLLFEILTSPFDDSLFSLDDNAVSFKLNVFFLFFLWLITTHNEYRLNFVVFLLVALFVKMKIIQFIRQ